MPVINGDKNMKTIKDYPLYFDGNNLDELISKLWYMETDESHSLADELMDIQQRQAFEEINWHKVADVLNKEDE